MTDKNTSRRNFIRNAGLTTSGVILLGPSVLNATNSLTSAGQDLKISVAEWSWHNTLFGGEMTNLDFAAKARVFEIEAIEYVIRRTAENRYIMFVAPTHEGIVDR